MDLVVEGRILEWGNSFGIRLRKADLDQAGLKPGQEVVVRVLGPGDKIDVSHVPTFQDRDVDLTTRKGKRKALGEAAWARHERKGRRSS